MRVWDLREHEQLVALEDHEGWIHSVALGELDGRPIAVSGGGRRRLISGYRNNANVKITAATSSHFTRSLVVIVETAF